MKLFKAPHRYFQDRRPVGLSLSIAQRSCPGSTPDTAIKVKPAVDRREIVDREHLIRVDAILALS